VEAVGMFALSNSMLLDFRSLVAGEPPVLKTFHVQNPCPYDMRVAWKMFNYARPDLPGAEQPWVFCDLEVAREAVRVKLGLRSYEPASPEDVRYRVEPTDTVVKSGQSVGFRVYYQSDQSGKFCSYLQGTQTVLHGDQHPLTVKLWEKLPHDEEDAAESTVSTSRPGSGSLLESAKPGGAGENEHVAGLEAQLEGRQEGGGDGPRDAAGEVAGEEEQGEAESPRSSVQDEARAPAGASPSTAHKPPRTRARPSADELAQAEKTMVLRGAFHPHAGAPLIPMSKLTVGLEALSLKPYLEPDDRKQMYFRLFSCNPLAHAQYHRKLTLTNLFNAPLTFTLSCKRPWAIVEFDHSVPQAPPLEEPLYTPFGFATQIHTLPPRESVEVSLDFKTPEEVLECNPDETEDLKFTSNVVAIFQPLGVEQFLPLTADYLFPAITVAVTKLSTASLSSKNCMDFGMVHLQAPRKLHLTLTNPTVVPAKWKLEGPAEADGYTVSPVSGLIEGHGLGFPQSTVIEVTFLPQAVKTFKRELVFTCKRGRSCSIVVEGQGTIDEVMETAYDRPRAWGLKYG